MTMNRKGQKTADPARKIGRPRKFTPERFWAVFEEYRKWAKTTPIYVSKVSAGQTISVPCERPLTLTGFCRFAEISRESFYNYEAKPEFSELLTFIREAIEADQFDGALVGVYDSSIVARVLRLADRKDITTNGQNLQPPGSVVTVTIDEAAASIIQSIGKQTIRE